MIENKLIIYSLSIVKNILYIKLIYIFNLYE